MNGDLTLLKNIRLVVFDFDGVFTDNRVLVSQDGHEAVFCTRADGIGLEALRRAGIPSFILSTEPNPVVLMRARKLKIDCIHGCDYKWPELKRQLESKGVPIESVAYLGNDVNDRECLTNVGVPVCVADAHPDVLPLAKLVTTVRGGFGAVREFCDAVVRAHGGA